MRPDGVAARRPGAGEAHAEIRDLVRRVAREKVAPRAAEIDALAQYPEDMFALLREIGLFTLPFPERYGGRWQHTRSLYRDRGAGTDLL